MGYPFVAGELTPRSNKALQVSHGTVLGHRYHTVSLMGYDWNAVEAWALEQFGRYTTVWNLEKGARWYLNSGRFWFRDDKDLSIFLLRWS